MPSEREAFAAALADLFGSAADNAFADAVALGVTLIDAGHFETENPVCGVLAQKLRTQFPEIEVFVSKTHADPIRFV